MVVIYKTANVGYSADGGCIMGILGRSRAPRPRTPFGRFFARPSMRRAAFRLRTGMAGRAYRVKRYR